MPPCSSPVLRHGQCQQLHLPSSLHAISQTRSQRVSPRHRNKTRLAWRSVSPSASRESSVHATSEPHDDRFSAQGEIKVQSRRQLLAQVTAAVAVVSGLTVPPALPSTHAAEVSQRAGAAALKTPINTTIRTLDLRCTFGMLDLRGTS